MKNNKRKIRFIPAFALSLLVIFTLFATSVLAFPGFAEKVVPNIPLMREIDERESKLDELNDEVEKLKENEAAKQSEIEFLNEEIEKLKIMIKEISEEQIKEVITSPNEDEVQNLMLQTFVVNFVKEMYKGNYESAAKYCTDEFAKTVINRPDDIIMRPDSSALVFTQITNIAKTEDGMFLVFLRLNDSGEEMEADYQLNFEIIMTGDDYYISFVGMDA